MSAVTSPGEKQQRPQHAAQRKQRREMGERAGEVRHGQKRRHGDDESCGGEGWEKREQARGTVAEGVQT